MGEPAITKVIIAHWTHPKWFVNVAPIIRFDKDPYSEIISIHVILCVNAELLDPSTANFP